MLGRKALLVFLLLILGSALGCLQSNVQGESKPDTDEGGKTPVPEELDAGSTLTYTKEGLELVVRVHEEESLRSPVMQRVPGRSITVEGPNRTTVYSLDEETGRQFAVGQCIGRTTGGPCDDYGVRFPSVGSPPPLLIESVPEGRTRGAIAVDIVVNGTIFEATFEIDPVTRRSRDCRNLLLRDMPQLTSGFGIQEIGVAQDYTFCGDDSLPVRFGNFSSDQAWVLEEVEIGNGSEVDWSNDLERVPPGLTTNEDIQREASDRIPTQGSLDLGVLPVDEAFKVSRNRSSAFRTWLESHPTATLFRFAVKDRRSAGVEGNLLDAEKTITESVTRSLEFIAANRSTGYEIALQKTTYRGGYVEYELKKAAETNLTESGIPKYPRPPVTVTAGFENILPPSDDFLWYSIEPNWGYGDEGRVLTSLRYVYLFDRPGEPDTGTRFPYQTWLDSRAGRLWSLTVNSTLAERYLGGV